MRLALDVSKAGASDGIGTFTRGLVGALSRRIGSAAKPGDTGADVERVLLYDLAGRLEETVLRDEFGELGQRFESRLGRTTVDDADVFLATSWQVPAGWRRPVVFVVYDLTFLTHPACHTIDNRIHSLEGCLQARLLDAHFVAISGASADQLSHHLDVEREQIRVVYPGREARFTDAGRTDVGARLRDRFGLVPGYVLAVGSLEPRKNLQRLIDAHRELDTELRRAHPLVVVGGGGWHNAGLEQSLRDAEARGDVHRMGRVTGTDLVSLYQGAALFAYPSLAEGFGLPLLEAMACGTPVVTSNVSSMPEVVADAALQVDPRSPEAIHQALADLLPDAARRSDLARRGLRRAQDFCWSRAADQVLEACHAAVAARRA